MRVHCDVCGLEIMKEDAIVLEDDGDVYYLCSNACAESQEFHETMADPAAEAANPPDLR
ncbi:MAG: TRASH domain-containing protein [Planctomycetota bacterium]